MRQSINIKLKNEAAMEALARVFAVYFHQGIIYLKGDLGAGKTRFAQYFIRRAGFSGRVKSPTYTLVEPYDVEQGNIFHFDLYRLEDEEELLFLGCDEYFEAANDAASNHMNVCLIEWPEKAASVLPRADIELRIEHSSVDARDMNIKAQSLKGEQLLNVMKTEFQSLGFYV